MSEDDDQELVILVGCLRNFEVAELATDVKQLLHAHLSCKLRLRNSKESTGRRRITASGDIVWNEEFYFGMTKGGLKKGECVKLSLRLSNRQGSAKLLSKMTDNVPKVRLGSIDIRIVPRSYDAWYPIEVNIKNIRKALSGSTQGTENTTFTAEINVGLQWCDPSSIPTVMSPTSKKGRKDSLMRRLISPPTLSIRKDSDEWKRGVETIGDSSNFLIWGASSRLRVSVIEARDLISADSNGLSDPYCYVMCRGMRQRTVTKKKTLNPVWNETFTFSPAERIDSQDEVLLFLRDYDFASSNDDLGQVSIPLWSVKPGNSEARWYPLQPTLTMKQDPDQCFGWVKAVIEFTPSAMENAAENDDPLFVEMNEEEVAELIDDDDDTDGEDIDNAESDLILGASNRKEAAVGSDRPTVSVWVIQARNLASADNNGYSDPFCKIKCRSDHKRTHTIRKSLNPRWETCLTFGKQDYITTLDSLEIEVFDKDFGVKDLLNDLLGTVTIPLWSVVGSTGDLNSSAQWFQLKSTRYSIAGELQLRIEYTNSSLALAREKEIKKLYKGKVWLYELQVSVLSARNLNPSNKKSRTANPYTVVECEGKKYKTSLNKKTLNPVWNQQFRFRNGLARSRVGLERDDKLMCTVFDRNLQDVAIGKVKIDIAYIVDRLGYIDDQGGELVDDFPLESPKQVDLSVLQDIDREKVVSFKQSSVDVKDSNKQSAQKAGVRAFTMRTLKGKTLASALASATTAATPSEPETFGDLRLKLKLLPVGETRKVKVSKIHVFVSKLRMNLPTPSDEPVPVPMDDLPRQLYVRITIGYFSKDTGGVMLQKHCGGVCNINAHLFFENDIDRMLDEDCKSVGAKATLSLCDSRTDQVVATKRLSREGLLQLCSKCHSPHWIQLEGVKSALDCEVNVTVTRVQIEEELKPIIGYFSLQLLQSKLYVGDFNRTIRTVVKYGKDIQGVNTVLGELSPRYKDLSYYIPATDMFKEVVIEVWTTKVSSSEDKRSSGKWGRLIGSVSLSPYELLELEAQLVFQNAHFLQWVQAPPVKLGLQDKANKVQGAIWVQASFTENLSSSGVFAPNPNPMKRPGKPFSFANLFHEMSRLMLIGKSFLEGTNKVKSVLDWDSPAVTLFALNVVVFFCVFDALSKRFLLLPVLAIIAHVVTKHQDRLDGTFLQNLSLSAAHEEADITARVRVAVVRAKGIVENEGSFVQVSLKSRTPKHIQPIGKTNVGKSKMAPEFTSGHEYSVKASASSLISPRVVQWESTSTQTQSKSHSSIPSFEFNIENVLTNWPLFEVTVHKARHLGKVGEAYVVLRVLHEDKILETRRTALSSKSQPRQPQWQEAKTFGRSRAVEQDDTLELLVYTSDVPKDDCIGSFKVRLSRLGSAGFRASTESASIVGVGYKSAWVKLTTSKGEACGELLLSLAWLDYSKLQDTNPSDSIAPDAWRRSSSEMIFELQSVGKAKDQFMGQCSLPLAALVKDETMREQPVFEQWVRLAQRFDGSRADRSLEGLRGESNGFGKVLIRAEIVLPDPQAKQMLIEKQEAKRADKASLIHKMRLLQNNLESLQQVLYQLNNTLERVQNLFNWSHPRRTQQVLMFFLILTIFLSVMESRVFLLIVAMFMFTEHFRPMGTMVLKMNHMVALLPTNDDLTDACSGHLLAAKRGSVGNSGSEPQVPQSPKRSDSSTSVTKRKRSPLKPFAPKRSVGFGLAVEESESFHSHLQVLHTSNATLLTSQKKRWYRRFVALQKTSLSAELGFWNDKDSYFEDLAPLHVLYIHSCRSSVSSDEDPEYLDNIGNKSLLFAVVYSKEKAEDAEKKTLFLAASSETKKDLWLAAISKVCMVLKES